MPKLGSHTMTPCINIYYWDIKFKYFIARFFYSTELCFVSCPGIVVWNPEACIEPSQTSTVKPFAEIYLFISSLFKVDLHLAYKKPINVNNNTAYISVNKLPSNNDNNKTKYLIVRQNQHVANRLYITYKGNQASTFLFFVWKILDHHDFWLFWGQVSIFFGAI